MKIPEGWPTEEMIEAGKDARMQCFANPSMDVAEAISKIFTAALAAAPTPPAQDDEPVVRIVINNGDVEFAFSKKQLDRMRLMNGAHLFTRPQSDKLREAAEDFIAFFNGEMHLVDDILALVDEHEQRLRDALEGKS